jgi:hypothetical protein
MHKEINIRKKINCLFTNFSICILISTKREEVTGNWMKFHIEEFHDLLSSSNIIREIK